MNADVLRRVLAVGGQEEGDGFVYDNGVTLMVDAGGSLMMVDKVKRVELRDGFVLAQTARGESYALDAEAVCGLKVDRLAESDSPGFLT